jgi:hypothetical protein
MQPQTSGKGHGESDEASPKGSRKGGDYGHQIRNGRVAGTVQPGIADDDKRARSGSGQEDVRHTPPAGDWNDVA